jgi:hypothetical protein
MQMDGRKVGRSGGAPVTNLHDRGEGADRLGCGGGAGGAASEKDQEGKSIVEKKAGAWPVGANGGRNRAKQSANGFLRRSSLWKTGQTHGNTIPSITIYPEPDLT